MNSNSIRLNDQSRQVLALAEEAARRRNHAYIGTEHILLSLLHEGTGLVVGAFQTLGVAAVDVGQEIDRLIQHGPSCVTSENLPHTPRARQAIEFAREEARFLGDRSVQPEHLLLGLMRETEGVAGQVLRNLGLQLERVREEVLKFRLLQLKIVERAVRPVRASTRRKRKMREELLAHLTSIYDAELARRNDPIAAVAGAARRFGDPALLSGELQSSVPWEERLTSCLHPWFGWRAPETAARWMMRLAAQLFFLLATTSFLLLAVIAVALRWDHSVWIAIRPATALVLFVPIAVMLLGNLYFKMRDAMFGVFGSPKSLRNAVLLDFLIALVVVALGYGFIAFAEWDLAEARAMLLPFSIAGIAMAIAAMLAVRISGPHEISDTVWACLDIEDNDRDASLYAE